MRYGRLIHPLLDPMIIAAVERSATAHRGTHWAANGFSDLGDRAAHPCGILTGVPFSVFAKLTSAADGRQQFTAELAGLGLITRLSSVATPTPIATGIVEIPASATSKRTAAGTGPVTAAGGTDSAGKTASTGRTASTAGATRTRMHAGTGAATPIGTADDASWLLLFEALPERTTDRTPGDYRGIGRTMATMHQVHHEQFGLADFDGYFGPFPQDNRPVPGNSWPDFYAERRVRPLLKDAVNSGQLPVELARGVERVLDRLPHLAGPRVRPSLLHGDAQQNNFLCTPSGPVVIDACPYFGHPEIDLALVDYFEPVPAELFSGYREIRPIDAGFADRRELWRIFAYLGVISADAQNLWGRQHLRQLANAVDRYG